MNAIATPLRRVPRELIGVRQPPAAAIAKAGFSSLEDLYDAIASQFQFARLNLDAIELGIDLADLIAKPIAEKHRIVPVFASPSELSIATSDPTQMPMFDTIGRQLKRAIVVVISTPAEIDRALVRLYEQRRAPVDLANQDNLSQEDLAAASHVVNSIIAAAIAQRASDIHIEASEQLTLVRLRVDGALRQIETRPIAMHAAIVSRIKVLAQLDISIHHAPQDGRIKLPTAAGEIDLRVSVLPTYWGEKVVCRLLDNKRAMLGLDALGFDESHALAYRKMINAPYGLVLVTGPTGSGKSTTLYAGLNAVKNPETNVVTVEDPVEYQLAGINQVQVAPKRGLTFASALRSILRQDPDVILVGEIRDQETGQLAAEAALTGHLVLSSMHTNDACSSIMRLSELGVEPFLVAPSLLGIVSQRLVRAVCKNCSERYEPNPDELASLGIPEIPVGTQVARGKGCAVCQRTGYSGRIAVREVLPIDDALRALITQRASVDELRAAALATGFKTMRFQALRLWLSGQTTTREVIRATRS